jgi:hypothetical protein
MRQGSCDAEQMVAFLEANPDTAAAWAGVLGIGVGEIRSYVATLTPVILRSDVYVTNHGFVNGRPTVIPAVLQAGTAVFVDRYGTPVVKCYCGNPLTKPPPRAPGITYVGPRWPGFTQINITVVVSTTVIIDTFTLVDPATNQGFGRPAGTDGSDDGPAPPPGQTGSSTSAGTAATTVPPTTASTGIPTNATYSVSATADCSGFGGASVLVSAVVANGTLTFSGGGESYGGPLNPDGSFNVPIQGFAIIGSLDANRLTASLDALGCHIALDGTRTG